MSELTAANEIRARTVEYLRCDVPTSGHQDGYQAIIFGYQYWYRKSPEFNVWSIRHNLSDSGKQHTPTLRTTSASR